MAEVVHVSPEGSERGPGVGLRFLEISEETQTRIDALLTRGLAMKSADSESGDAPKAAPQTEPPTPAAAEPPKPLTRDELLAELMSIRGRAAHEVLRVPADADEKAIADAYRQSMQRYSPVRLGQLDDSTAEVVKVLCTYLRYAYDELRKTADDDSSAR